MGICRSKHWIKYLHGGALPKRKRIYTVLKGPRRPIWTHLQAKKSRLKTDSFNYMRTVGPSNIAHSGGSTPLRVSKKIQDDLHIMCQKHCESRLLFLQNSGISKVIVYPLDHVGMIKILMYNSSALLPGDAVRWQLFCNEVAYNEECWQSTADYLRRARED